MYTVNLTLFCWRSSQQW